jgi:hypothetical protein
VTKKKRFFVSLPPRVNVEAVGHDGDDPLEEAHRFDADRVRLEVVEFRQLLGTQEQVRRQGLLPENEKQYLI